MAARGNGLFDVAGVQAFSPVLLVDDDDTYAQRLAQALRERGLAVVCAADAYEAIAAARRQTFRCALLDVRLPGPSGLDLIVSLKAIAPHLRMVMLTGYGNIATAVAALKVGAFDYLTKPCDADTVLEKLAGFAAPPTHFELRTSTPSLARVEWEHMTRVVADCDGNLTHAAKILGIHRRSLQRKLKLEPPI
jgi:two-component system response regulator RegA